MGASQGQARQVHRGVGRLSRTYSHTCARRHPSTLSTPSLWDGPKERKAMKASCSPGHLLMLEEQKAKKAFQWREQARAQV